MTRFALRPSRLLASAFIAAHVAAGALVFPLQIDIRVQAFLWALVAASLSHALARHALLRTRNALVSGLIRDAGNATVTLRDGTELAMEILGTTYVTPMLTVLNLRAQDEHFARHVLFAPDNIDREDYRKLRVVLKWARGRDARNAGITPSDDCAP